MVLMVLVQYHGVNYWLFLNCSGTEVISEGLNSQSNGSVPHGSGATVASPATSAAPVTVTSSTSTAKGMFSKTRVGSFSFGAPLLKSFEQFDSDGGEGGLNLWKKCTSYSPKIKHILPKWTRLSMDGGSQPGADGAAPPKAADGELATADSAQLSDGHTDSNTITPTATDDTVPPYLDKRLEQ